MRGGKKEKKKRGRGEAVIEHQDAEIEEAGLCVPAERRRGNLSFWQQLVALCLT